MMWCYFPITIVIFLYMVKESKYDEYPIVGVRGKNYILSLLFIRGNLRPHRRLKIRWETYNGIEGHYDKIVGILESFLNLRWKFAMFLQFFLSDLINVHKFALTTQVPTTVEGPKDSSCYAICSKYRKVTNPVALYAFS